LLAKDTGDLWDSGKVQSDNSLYIEYAGIPLQSRQLCFWKVKTWSSCNDRSQGNSSESKPAMWSMGLLRQSDPPSLTSSGAAGWSAKWIGSPNSAEFEPAPLLRKTFSINRKIKRATAYISGLGYYELTLNGEKVGDHVLDPKFTRYDRRVLYVTYDVTRQLKKGKNAAGVMLGNGWYNYHVKNAWDFDTAPWRGQPKMILQLEIELYDGSRQTVISDESWKYSTGPIQFDGMLSGEVYDARLEKNGWDTANYDDSQWITARIVDAPKGKLTAQMVQPIRITETIRPVKITQPKPGVYLYDLGQNIAGTAQLTVKGPAGTDIKIQYAELLREDGTLNPDNIKSFCKSAEFQTERYILKGKGTEIWQSRFMYHGFQYVQVTGFPGEPKLENLKALVMHTDLENAGTFECSNELLNRIQHCTRWSYLNNFHGHPTDCPNREKNGWTGDAHLAAETGLYNFDPLAAYTQWMRDFKDEQRESGELPGIVPTGGWGYKWGNGPAWDSAYVLIPWYMYKYCGDIRILAEHYENLKRYVDYLTSKAKDGIVTIGLGDWCPAKTKTPEKVTSTGYYYCDVVIVSKIADILGKKDDAAKYSRLAADIKRAFNREFLDQRTGQYAGGTQTALACALYQGLVEPSNHDAVVKNLVENVTAKNDHLDCGILGTKYLLHALTDNDRSDVAYRIVAQTTEPSWGNWVKQGATTLWEGWNGSGTHNHIMFGDVSAWFYETLAGIQPDPSVPGFKKIIIKPGVVDDLTWVKASHNSVYGRIASNWKLEGNKLTLNVTIPPNTTATVFVPARDASSVLESGKPAEKAQGIKFLRMDNSNRKSIFAVYETGSGSYCFISQTE
ncbi:MAG: glycoside hydrolase family 78 protein, partial [Kiritimatiellae bacterium]|nr:glycoside hydrolase family 78 protein [Kiritimatiellia bacterium]